MNISEMTPREKSDRLCVLAGFHLPHESSATYPEEWKMKTIAHEAPPNHPDLYDEKNMELAWRVLNWALRVHTDSKHFDSFFIMRDELRLALKNLWGTDFAQTAWLDRILRLAIDAGMIE